MFVTQYMCKKFLCDMTDKEIKCAIMKGKKTWKDRSNTLERMWREK